MNWDAVDFDWNHIRAFLATVEHGSLSGAARALRQTQPTLSRQISALEDTLQVTLFERGTRIMQLTEAGRQLLPQVRHMAEAATQISRVATGQNQTVEGLVRITCSDAMAAFALPSVLVEMQAVNPGIRIELIAANDLKSLSRRDADIALRHVRPDEPDLIAKRIGDITVSLFASESYMRRLGPVSSPADLSRAQFIGYESPERLIPQLAALGIAVNAKSFAITSSTGSAMYELARAGAGIAILPESVAEGRLALTRVLPDLPSFAVPTWLVTHREIKTSRRIRLTFDYLVSALTEDGWKSLVAKF
ncbi:LysR family transcriptional regulator [Cognatishimia sp. SS12]|uniref:LysR family transcriptional regulator n=1 Tax=Cognatishimia sp. SS12 TaxID=2979465 RepID=UPI00232ACFC7|nr:LysR family transcriptional regulator [Cognatishimia sp. SS12]MDC0737056.1 LysR family transcriptional regulator [Cognatishimia sp. SS12]